MSNRAAWFVFVLILASLVLVFAFVDGAPIFLARKFADLVNWLAFWR